MAAERKTTISTIGILTEKLDNFSGRLEELEQLKATQETTILVKEKEKTVAHSQIKVRVWISQPYFLIDMPMMC